MGSNPTYDRSRAALRGTHNVRRSHPRQPHLQPPDVAVEVLRGRSAEGLDELVVAGVQRVHVLDVIAACVPRERLIYSNASNPNEPQGVTAGVGSRPTVDRLTSIPSVPREIQSCRIGKGIRRRCGLVLTGRKRLKVGTIEPNYFSETDGLQHPGRSQIPDLPH